MTFTWDAAKDDFLRKVRGISFERVVVAIEMGELKAVLEHPRPAEYPGQRLFVVEVDGYAWVVPHRREGSDCVLITAYPSRKYTRRYLRKP
jgi:hypothetical protein